MPPEDPSGARPAPVVLRIKLRYDDVEAMIQRFAPNVGKTGLFLPTKSIQPVGSEIKFELRLSTDQPVLVGLGRVKAVREPDPENPRATFGIAVELMRVTRESRDLILKMLERRKALDLPDTGLPMPADIDAARRADLIDTGITSAATSAVPHLVSATDSSPSIVSEPLPFTAPRRQSGPIAVAKLAIVEPLAPEPPRKKRPPIADLIASVSSSSGPIVASFTSDALDEDVDVSAVLARARSLVTSNGTDVDSELDALLESSAAPREIDIDIEAASAELARHLGGAAVRRGDRSGRGGGGSAGWAPPPPTTEAESPASRDVGVSAAAAIDAARDDAARDDAGRDDAGRDGAGRDDAGGVDATPADPTHGESVRVDAAQIAAASVESAPTDATPVELAMAMEVPASATSAPATSASVVLAAAGSPAAATSPAAAAKAALAKAALAKAGPARSVRDTSARDTSARDMFARDTFARDVEAANARLDDDDELDEPTPVSAIEPLLAPDGRDGTRRSSSNLIHDDADVAAFDGAGDEEPAHEVEPEQIHDEIHRLDEGDFEEVEHTQVGEQLGEQLGGVDPNAFDQHGYATLPAASEQHGLADRLERQLDEAEREDLGFGSEASAGYGAAAYAHDAGGAYEGGGAYADSPVAGVADDEVEEIDDFEILAEADAEDADLLAAAAEREVTGAAYDVPEPREGYGGAMPDRGASEGAPLADVPLAPEHLPPEAIGADTFAFTPDPDPDLQPSADDHGFELPPVRPSFLARLELDDDSGYHAPLAASHYDDVSHDRDEIDPRALSAGHALRGFEDSDHGVRGESYRDAYGERSDNDEVSDFGSLPQAPYEGEERRPSSVGESSYTFADNLTGGGADEDFDAPHGNYGAPPSSTGFVPPDAFDQSDVISIRPDVSASKPHKLPKQALDEEGLPDLESALEALDVDLDDLGGRPDARRPSGPTVRRGARTSDVPTSRGGRAAVPDPRYLATSPTEDAGARNVRQTGGRAAVVPPVPRAPARPTPKPWDPIEPADEPAPKRAATDDGIVIDFDDD